MFYYGIRLPGEIVKKSVEHFTLEMSGILVVILENPSKHFLQINSYLFVLITAAGLQG
jgi:hypothetical protein